MKFDMFVIRCGDEKIEIEQCCKRWKLSATITVKFFAKKEREIEKKKIAEENKTRKELIWTIPQAAWRIYR